MGESASPALPVVAAVGASAGGLEAFRRFLRALPDEPGIAFVLIQHLDPNHDSLLAELVGKVTDMPVSEVKGRLRLEPDHVYVIAPDTFLEFEDGHVVAVPTPTARHLRLPFDHFLNSLAHGLTRRACAVVLSGTGSDGTVGVRAVKEQGGLVIAQDPNTAEHHGMPTAAISSHAVDFVLEIEDMGAVLVDYAKAPYVERPKDAPPETDEERRQFIDEALDIVHDQTGSDFSGYRPATVQRRIQRRMGLSCLVEPEQYLKLLRSSPDEVAALAKDMVISVTGFFRDPEAFRVLEREVIPKIVEAASSNRAIRVWVPGCATGEEAYSLCMAFREQMPASAELDVFATDIDDEAIERARAGVYSASVVANIPPKHLEKYFQQVGDHQYQIRQRLRDSVAFARQNLLADPPFSKMDLVSCRNLLIYLDGHVQSKVQSLFHFALRPGGFLFLGSSESVGSSTHLFEPLSKPWRIFQRRDAVVSTRFPASPLQRKTTTERRTEPRSEVTVAERALVQAAVDPSVVVDEDHSVLFIHGDLNSYLKLPVGEPRLSLTSMLRADLRSRVRAGLFKALRDDEIIHVRSAQVGETSRELVSVTIRPVRQDGARLAVLSFEVRSGSADPEVEQDEISVVRELEDELESTREELRITVEELEASNEELKSSNEEIMSANEELQSSNEELETTTEELRALNQELSTVNTQLKVKIEEVEEARNDLANLVASTKLSVVFLGPELQVKRFTQAAAEYMRLLHSDIGRPVSDIVRNFEDPDLEEDARKVLADLTPREAEIETSDGRWLQRRILPYRTSDDRIAGVVLVLHDITEIKLAGFEVERREQQQITVKELGLRALSGKSFVELAQAASRMASSSLGVGLAKVLELDEENDRLDLIAGVGWRDGLVGSGSVPTHLASQAGFTLRSRIPVVVEDLASETRFHGPDLLFDHDVVSGVSVPIQDADGSPWGVLGAHSRRHRSFDRHDVHFMQSLATVLGAAIQRDQALQSLRSARSQAESALASLRQEDERKDRFLAVLGHELRNPLASIGNAVELLGRDAKKETVDRAIETIRRSVSRLSILLDDLLDVQRISRGKISLRAEIVDLGALVTRVVDSVEADAEAKGLTLHRDIEPVAVRGDEVRLEQVAINLLRNAIRYTPEGGNVHARLRRDGDRALLEVRDDGVGISEQDAEVIFEPFHQVRQSPFGSGGLGIGLTLVRQLVELHDGSVGVASEGRDQGSTFRIELPASREAPPARDDVESGPSVRDLRILVVDDNRDACLSVAELLEMQGNEVATAFDGATAIETAQEFKPRAILLDISLPDMTGYDVVETLRSRGTLDGTQVISVSGFGHREAQERSHRAGIEHHLVKPVDFDSLLQLLGRLKR